MEVDGHGGAVWRAVCQSSAVARFTPDGTIVDANPNFLLLMGYALDDIVGRHHRIFCAPDYVQSMEYGRFWRKLGAGRFDGGRYRRITRRGDEVWLQATYNPVFDEDRRVCAILKVASDVTRQVRREQGIARQLAERERLQDVLEAQAGALQMRMGELAQLVGSIGTIAAHTNVLVRNAAGGAAREGASGATGAAGPGDRRSPAPLPDA